MTQALGRELPGWGTGSRSRIVDASTACLGPVSRRTLFRALLAAIGCSDGRAQEAQAAAGRLVRGIYLSHGSLQTEEKLQGFIRLAKAFGVDTFVIDLAFSSPRYVRCVRTVQAAGLTYVPRIIVFPDGGTDQTVLRRDFWDSRLRLVDLALSLGARRVQLDYIRYREDQAPDRQNAFDILEVVRFFADEIHGRGATLELDVFGEAAGGPSERIGQDLRLFAPHVDGINPMAYPSHYRPYEETWQMPFQIVSASVRSAQKLMGPRGPAVTAYIEMFNARHQLSEADRAVYVRAQLQGARAAGARGWYAWSSTNSYGLLFDLLSIYGDDLERGEPPEGLFSGKKAP